MERVQIMERLLLEQYFAIALTKISCYILQACNNLQVCQKCKIQNEANEDSLAFLTSVQVIVCLKKVQKCSMKQ